MAVGAQALTHNSFSWETFFWSWCPLPCISFAQTWLKCSWFLTAFTLSMADLHTVCRTAIGLINRKRTLKATKTYCQHLPKACNAWPPSELEALTNTGLWSIMEPLCSRGVQDHVSCMTMYSATWSWHECVAFVKSTWDSAYNCRCCGRPGQLLGSVSRGPEH